LGYLEGFLDMKKILVLFRFRRLNARVARIEKVSQSAQNEGTEGHGVIICYTFLFTTKALRHEGSHCIRSLKTQGATEFYISSVALCNFSVNLCVTKPTGP
jgi:hypothetical protein